jgi:uncharacterized membrane protein
MSNVASSQNAREIPKADKSVSLVYFVYIVSIIAAGFPALIGVVLAYLSKGAAPAWAVSHYRFQIRTFWIGLLFILIVGSFWIFSLNIAADNAHIGAPLILLDGLFVLLFLIWIFIRCFNGWRLARRRSPYPAPGSWIL